MSATHAQPPEEDSPGISERLSVLERLVEGQVKHAQIISKQEQHLSALRKQREIQLMLDPKYVQFQDGRQRKREIKEQWHNEILKWDPLQNWPQYDDRSFHDILPPVSVKQLWTTWQYRAAYPNAEKFLAKATSTEKSRSIITCDSFFPTGELVEKWSSEQPYAERTGKKVPMPERMWDIVKRRIVVDRIGESGMIGERLPSRLLCILDISPIVAAILLTSTPKSVVSNVSPFLERHLTFTNFGKASMQSVKSETVNSFIFEYHFAFYYVTKDSLETHLVFTDVRKLRKFSWFGQRSDTDTYSRHIYEEQMSFILMGHGQDTYTCYQLGEKYFNGPKPGEFRTFVNSPTWTPSTLYLSWIAMALHHVAIRWEDAIAAVDTQIASEEAVVFHQMNNFNLASGAKDLQIATLRTYFWAIEAYKLFEETLETTINAWEQFKRHSLDKVNDGRNSEDYAKSVELIELAIDRLRDKIERIRKKSEQVLRLRDGLFYVTSLSDTSVTINQGENIRLLTYFTILFLPLSFSTSIFGMQSILPSTTSMKTFTIVLPVVTVSTLLAVFILTGALQDVQQAISKIMPNLGHKLRDFIWEHPRKKFGTEQFHRTRASIGQQSVWKYLAFFVELCLISVPVHEVKGSVDLYGLYKRRPASGNGLSNTMSETHLRSQTTLTPEYGPDIGEGNAKSRARQVTELKIQLAEKKSARRGLILVILQQIPTIIFAAIRMLLLCLWIPLLLLEYVVLLFWCPPASRRLEPMQLDSQVRMNKGEQVKRFFTRPLLFLGFDISQFQIWRKRAVHEHRSPLPPSGPYDLALTHLPSSYLYPDQIGTNQAPVLGREQGVRGAQRIRRAMAQPNFQAAYQQQSLPGSNPTVVPAQHNVHLRSHGCSSSRGGNPRPAGGVWMNSEQEPAGV